MENEIINKSTPRRNFLGTLTNGAALIGLATLASPLRVLAQAKSGSKGSPASGQKSEADLWFDKIHGTHRVVYDATRPHEIMPFVWPKVFLLSNAQTGSPASDCGVVVVLRHDAICYAFQDAMWAKYDFADAFKAGDPGGAFQAIDAATATKTRNPFLNTSPGDFKVPGVGAVDIGIKDLMADGVMFCVCQMAMTVLSAAVAGKMGMDAKAVLQDWTDHLVPGIQPVPSGVWALGRAQEHKCAYTSPGRQGRGGCATFDKP